MRLIDADNLIKKLKPYAECDWNKSLCSMLPNVVDDCIEFVDEQPTAYDIDKVVEEIELNGKNTDVCIRKIKAIEIVKNGGISYDVCEWEIDGVYLHSPHKPLVTCNIDENYRYNYCPVCGKKIKVVE